MDIFFYIVSNIFTPIVVAILTVILTAIVNNKSNHSKLIVIYSKNLDEKSNLVNNKDSLYVNYTMNLQFENEFKNFLKERQFFLTFFIDDLLLKTYKIYKSKEYKENKYSFDDEIYKICKMFNCFKNESEFIFHIKRFEVFYENSLWNFKIINISSSMIYDLNIDFCSKNLKKNNVSKDFLKFNEYINLNLIYFDFGIRINSYDFGKDIPFEFGYSKYKNLSFYMVKKRKYNKKDEIIFKVSFLDQKAKNHEYYFCSKEVKVKNTY